MDTAPLLGDALSIGICILIRFGPEMLLAIAFETFQVRAESLPGPLAADNHYDHNSAGLRILMTALSSSVRADPDP